MSTRLHAVHRLRMNGAIPPLPVYVFIPCTGSSLCYILFCTSIFSKMAVTNISETLLYFYQITRWHNP